MRTSLIVALLVCMPVYANDAQLECQNSLMNDIHSEVIYDLSSDIVQISNELIQAEISSMDSQKAPDETLAKSVDSVTELSLEIQEQGEDLSKNHPQVSFLDRARSKLASTSKTLIAFSKKAFEVTKEKSIIAGTFIARESKKAFAFLRGQANDLKDDWDKKQLEKQKNKEELIAHYQQFRLSEDKFTTKDLTYTSKILRNQESLSQIRASSQKNEKVLVYYFQQDKIYHLTSDNKAQRVSPLLLRTIAMKDLSQITLETNFIKNEEVKKLIISEKKTLEGVLDAANAKLNEDLTSAEHLIAVHRISTAIVDLKDKMHKLKNQTLPPVVEGAGKKDVDITQSQALATKDGEKVKVYEIDM